MEPKEPPPDDDITESDYLILKCGIRLEDFVRIWQTSEHVAEVAERIGKPRTKKGILFTSTLAWELRKRGLHLKRMKRGPKRLDLVRLNALAAKHLDVFEYTKAKFQKTRVDDD